MTGRSKGFFNPPLMSLSETSNPYLFTIAAQCQVTRKMYPPHIPRLLEKSRKRPDLARIITRARLAYRNAISRNAWPR